MNEHVRNLRPEKSQIAVWSPWGALPKSRSRRPRQIEKAAKPALLEKERTGARTNREADRLS